MPKQVFGFDSLNDVRRVLKAVKKSESADITGKDGGRWDSNSQLIMAQLTSDDGGDPKKFAWSQVRLKADGSWEAVGMTGTTTVGYAVDPYGVAVTNDYVALMRVPVNNGSGVFDLAWSVLGGDFSGQYQGQVNIQLTDRSRGWDYPILHAV